MKILDSESHAPILTEMFRRSSLSVDRHEPIDATLRGHLDPTSD